NLTAQGIGYLTVTGPDTGFVDWPWLAGLPPADETPFVRHVALTKPLRIKIDGKSSVGVIGDK
ncbi:MAG: hypothetical protein WAU91_21610, partial [Desulfatitalea sp.]